MAPQRHGSERGASVVEFALFLPLIVTILLGIVDTAFVMNDSIRIRHGLKTGSRLVTTDDYAASPAAVEARETSVCQGIAVPFYAAEEGSGTPAVSLRYRAKWALCRIAKVLEESGFDDSQIRIRLRMVTPATNGFDYLTSDQLNGSTPQALMACLTVATSSRTGFLSSLYDNKDLQARIIIPMATPDPITPDQSLSSQLGAGGDWRFCSPDGAAS
jgi:TadE-like protein